MNTKPETKVYDLEQRTKLFALKIRDFCKELKKDTINIEYIKQIIRSSASVGANYIEANDNLGEKDLLFRIKICRKEAKETLFWLDLLIHEKEDEINLLKKEATEIMLIFGAILKKLSIKQ